MLLFLIGIFLTASLSLLGALDLTGPEFENRGFRLLALTLSGPSSNTQLAYSAPESTFQPGNEWN